MSSNPAAAPDDLAGCGLCCPDDPLDEVMGCYLPVLDDGFMDALGVSGPHRPRTAAGRRGEPTLCSRGGGGAQEPPADDFDVDMFFADDAPDDGGAAANYVPCHAAVASAPPPPAAARGTADPRGVGPTHPAPPPTLPARDALDCDDFATVSAPPLQARDVFDHISEPPPARGAMAGALVPYWAPPPAREAKAGALVPYWAPPSPERDVFDGVFPLAASPPPQPLPMLLPAQDDALAGALVPYCAAPLPVHDGAVPAVLPPATASWSSTSSGSGCASSMTTCWGETDSPPRALSSPLCATWLVPRRKRTRPITRRNYGWLPKHQLHAAARPPLLLPPPPPRATATSLKATSKIKRPVEKVRQRNRQQQRACSHCSNTETPQWRAGPLGPGTLCNACGIRYKQNGKLFEEYRPSTSPSFDSVKHSNRHRKVVKLAERKQALLKLTTNMADDTVPPGPPPCAGGGEFMDVCTYISTG